MTKIWVFPRKQKKRNLFHTPSETNIRKTQNRNHVKQVQKIKKEIRKGLRRPNLDDPFEAFILGTDLRYTRFRDSERVLGQTFQFLVLQDFHAITPNLLARTVETVQGGGVIVLLLDTIGSLKQLYAMTMVRFCCLPTLHPSTHHPIGT